VDAVPALELQLLGPVVVRRRGDGARWQPVTLQAKRLALLAHLALVPAPVRRDTLLLLFWPELTDANARGALSKALHYLRATVGGEVIVTAPDDTVTVDRARVTTDVAALDAALAAGRAGDALALWRGPLLDGFHLDDAPDFARWVDAERTRLVQRVTAAAQRRLDALEAAGDVAGAATLAQLLVDRQPFDEPALQRLLRLLDRLGDRVGAVRTYERFATALAREFELAPSPETRALVEAIRAREAAAPDAIPPLPPLPEPVVRDATAATADVPAPAAMPASASGATRGATVVAAAPSRRPMLAVAGALVAVVAIGVGVVRARPATAAGAAALDVDRVVVVPFLDRSGDTTLASLPVQGADWITQGLAQAPMLRVVPVTTAIAVARAAGDSAGVARIATETGAATVITGGAYRSGADVLLQATVTDARTDAVVGSIAPVRVVPGRPLDALDTLRARVLAIVGPHLDHRLAPYARIVSRPPSYEAYRDHAAGLEHFVAGEFPQAMRHFARAAGPDGAWTAPVVLLGIAASNVRDVPTMQRVVTTLAPRRATLPPYDRAGYDAVAAWLAGDRLASYEAARRIAALAPGGIPAAQVGKEALDLGRPREAWRVLAAMDPTRGELRGFVPYWINLADAAHLAAEPREEAAVATRARAQFGEEGWIHAIDVFAALRRLDRAAVRALVADTNTTWLRIARTREGSWLLREYAAEAWAHGDTTLGRELATRGAQAIAALPDSMRRTPRATTLAVEMLLMAGRADDAQRLLDAVPPTVADVNLLGLRLVVAATRGDAAAVRRWDAALGALPEPPRWGQDLAWRARAAGAAGDAATAAQRLREAFAAGYAWTRRIHADPAFARVRTAPALQGLLDPRE
jgi:DNA-binding SARP family transcriptional activator/TolB-like protein